MLVIYGEESNTNVEKESYNLKPYLFHVSATFVSVDDVLRIISWSDVMDGIPDKYVEAFPPNRG